MGRGGGGAKGRVPIQISDSLNKKCLKSQKMKRATKIMFSCLARFKIHSCCIFTQFNTSQIDKWISSESLTEPLKY